MAGIDARLYSRAAAQPVESLAGDGTTAQDSYIPPERNLSAGATPAGVASDIGAQVRQGASLVEPTRLESLGASFQQSVPMAAWQRITRPEFEPDTKDSPQFQDVLSSIPFELTEPEYNALRDAKTFGERMWYKDRFTEQRDTSRVAGENPLQHMAVSVGLDPTTYVGGFAAFQAGKLVKAAAAAKALGAARAVGPISAEVAAGVAGTAEQASMGLARTAGAVAAGSTEGVANYIASQTHPMSTTEQAMIMLAVSAGGAMMVSKAGKLVHADPDLPVREMQESVSKPHMRMTTPARYVTDALGNEVKVADAVLEEIPRPLRADASASPQEIAQAVEQQVDTQVKSWGKSFGETVSWNVHKTLRSLSKAGEEIADLFVDNNAKYGINSVESEKAAVLRDLGTHQWAYEDGFRAELARRGHGTFKQLFAGGEVRQASAALEEEIKREMLRRDTFFRQGKAITADGVDPAVFKLADQLDNAFGASLDEMKAAGVFGAENLKRRPGYFTRVHSASRMEAVLDELKSAGMTEEKARRQLVNMYRGSVRRANPDMAPDVADDIAGALVDRTLRKGRLEDSPRNSMYGGDTAAEVRDILQGAGISGERLQRALDAMVGKVDEQGKAGYLKHRIDLDYTASMVVNGRVVSVADMIEGNMNTLLDTYLHGVSAKTAFARKGLVKQSDLLAKRKAYIEGAVDKEKARDMFDNMVAHLEGRPTGEKMSEFMRNAGMYSRMITLGASAIWQATEYATMAHRYGFLKTFKYAMAEMPLFRNLMETAATDKVLSRELKDVLTNQADQSIRLRPFIGKFEDNFEMPKNSQLSQAARQGTQMVPYLNGMKYIHAHQARVQANLILDIMNKASNGNAKARELLKGYGIEAHGMDKLSIAMKTHGTAVDKWDAATWRAVRPALTKMVDEGVLHARLGDMPAYAMFSQTGKFIFQYRSFVLSAHNKILAGTASRHGLGAVALMSAYQMPLAMMATQANEVASGRPPLPTDKLIVKSIGQMGSLGGITELWNWLSGNKREVGATGLIPFDRAIRAGGSTMQAVFGEGSGGQAAKDAAALTPLFAVVPGFKMLTSLMVPKE